MTQYLLTDPRTREVIEQKQFDDLNRAVQFLTKQWGLNAHHQATLRSGEPVVFAGTRSLQLFDIPS